ncbi:MAG: hypothetical protein OFPI_43470 [Osedax symbiont Rs2]|nr:MAG: hypothetical protein OFPI_43470 [Osedax symbiont Rs2]
MKEVKFICHIYYLLLCPLLGSLMMAYVLYGFFMQSAELIPCLIMGIVALWSFYSISLESPRLEFNENTLVINRWFYKQRYKLSEILGIQQTSINRHSGIYIEFRSGQTFLCICAPQKTAQAIEFIR